jgi:hypothetical protein
MKQNARSGAAQRRRRTGRSQELPTFAQNRSAPQQSSGRWNQDIDCPIAGKQCLFTTAECKRHRAEGSHPSKKTLRAVRT